MRCLWVVVLLTGLVLSADEPAPKRVLEVEIQPGTRYSGFNRVTYTLRVSVRKGLETEKSTESVQRTERFLDKVVRAGAGGVFEIERTYNMAQVKIQNDDSQRKELKWSPMNGRTVRISERARRRDVRLDGRGVVDSFTRRTVAMELDWRDIFSDHPVGPGDEWDAETTALGRRMAAYLNSGDKSVMKVRYEENIVRDGRELAKLYIDWELQGMRDRNLFTKVILAGDVLFDFEIKRIVSIDLGGSISLNGILMVNDQPQIVKGDGPLKVESSLKPAPLAVEAAAPGSEEEPADEPADK